VGRGFWVHVSRHSPPSFSLSSWLHHSHAALSLSSIPRQTTTGIRRYLSPVLGLSLPAPPHSHAALSLFEPLAVNNRNPPLLVAGRRLSHLHRSPPLTISAAHCLPNFNHGYLTGIRRISLTLTLYPQRSVLLRSHSWRRVPCSSHRRRNSLKHTAWICCSPSRLCLQLRPQSGILSSNCWSLIFCGLCII